jgi:hypothetical protein
MIEMKLLKGNGQRNSANQAQEDVPARHWGTTLLQNHLCCRTAQDSKSAMLEGCGFRLRARRKPSSGEMPLRYNSRV